MPHPTASFTACAGLLALLLAGCSGLRTIESEVRASVPPPAAPTDGSSGAATKAQPTIELGAHYRFERLPSQAEDPTGAEAIEAMAEVELKTAGLIRDEAQPRYSVQVSIDFEPFYMDDWGRRYPGMPPYERGFFSTFGVFIGSGRVGPGTSIGMGWSSQPPSMRYQYAATLLIRNLSNTQIVYETRATHEGPWADRDNILPALLAAALKDFPQPHAGRVKIEIPR
jgi:hypothetical protein